MREKLAENRGNSIRIIAQGLNIANDTVQMIMEQDLQKRKICSRCVPQPESRAKEYRVLSCQEWVQPTENDPGWLNSFTCTIVPQRDKNFGHPKGCDEGTQLSHKRTSRKESRNNTAAGSLPARHAQWRCLPLSLQLLRAV